jgi:hypothetical protein
MKQDVGIYINGETILPIGEITYSQDLNDFTGYGTIKTPFKQIYWDLVDDANSKVGIVAGSHGSDLLFNGKIKYAQRISNDIVLDVIDNGYLLKTPYRGTYKSKKISQVITDIAKQCDYSTVFEKVSEYVLEQKISRSSQNEIGLIETNTQDVKIGDTASTITGSFVPCNNCSTKYQKDSYVSSVRDSCPKCLRTYTLTVADNSFYCDTEKGGCGTYYCGVCGYEKITNSYKHLTLTYGPIAGEEFIGEPQYSPSGSTCEDELRHICDVNNLYIYITPDQTCHVREFNGFPYPEFSIPNIYIREKNHKYFKNLAQKIKGIDVQYRDGKLSADLGELTQDPTKERIYLNRTDLIKSTAQQLANNMLLQQIKKIDTDIEIEVPLEYYFIPGKWAQVGFYSMDIPLNIVKTFHKITPRLSTTKIQLKLYPDTITLDTIKKGINPINLTEQNIGLTASRFDFNYICHDKNCMEQKKMGDSFAMSEWLYDNLQLAGFVPRIVEYDIGSLNNTKFRYIEIRNKRIWEDFNYSKYNIDQRFWPIRIRKNKKVIK